MLKDVLIMLTLKKIGSLIICIIALLSCSQKVKPIPYLGNGEPWDKSIVVLGDWDGDPITPDTYLHWAPVNVGFDAVGEIASTDDHRLGRLYQWGAGDVEANKLAKSRYVNEPKPKYWYNELDIQNAYTGDRWNNNYGPCPKGWRLPTAKEFEALIIGKNGGCGWTTSGQYAGANTYSGAEFFGMNEDTTSGHGVFFPAVGYFSGNYGSIRDYQEIGAYWDSDSNQDALSSTLVVNPERCFISKVRHANGQSVRCVHDVAK